MILPGKVVTHFCDVRINDRVSRPGQGGRADVIEVSPRPDHGGGWLTLKEDPSGLVHDVWQTELLTITVIATQGRGRWIDGKWHGMC